MLIAHNISHHISRNVSGGARASTLLRDINARFARGELVAVVGPNGAGKTTLLRCLSGELTPSAGHIEFGERPLTAWRRDALARARAVLPQNSTLDFPFAVRDVVLMGRMPHTTSPARDNAIATAALALCDCAQFDTRAYTSLSGGEAQRVQTARALAQIWEATDDARARFLLLDEPVSALDLRHQYALMRALRDFIRREPIGVVCVLHNLNLAAQFADRVLLLDGGRLITSGTPQQVFQAELLQRVFNCAVAVQPHPEDAAIPLLIPRLKKTPTAS